MENDNGEVKLKIKLLEEEKYLSPEEVLTIMIGEIKDYVEKKIGETITSAVMTVPSGFSGSQRQV